MAFFIALVGPVALAQQDLPPLLPLSATENHYLESPSGESALPESPALPPDYFDQLDKKVFRWNDETRTIMVFIENGDRMGMPNWTPYHNIQVQAAFAEWEQALDGRFHFVYMPDKRGSDVTVSWKHTLSGGRNKDQVGVNHTVTWGEFIQRNDIELGLHDEAGRLYQPEETRAAALHEIGHMLGIKGHSDHPDDIMAPAMVVNPDGFGESGRHLTARDINTMKRIYSEKPDYTNPEGYHLSNFDAFRKTQKKRRWSIMWVVIGGIPVPIPLPF